MCLAPMCAVLGGARGCPNALVLSTCHGIQCCHDAIPHKVLCRPLLRSCRCLERYIAAMSPANSTHHAAALVVTKSDRRSSLQHAQLLSMADALQA